MEIGGMDVKEPQVQVPWIPTTPVKPVVPKSLPICTPGEKTQMGLHANAEVACSELSLGQDGSVLAATMGKIGGDNVKFFEQTASDTVLNCSNLSFSEHLLVAEAASANSIDGLKNPVISSTIHDNSCDPQGTSHVGCCSKRPSEDTRHTRGDAIKADSRQIAPMQINMEEKDSGGEETNDPARKLDNNGIPPTKELIDPVMEVAAVSSPFKENHNTDSVVSQQIDLSKTPQQKTRRRKHRPKVVVEGKPKRARKPATRKTDQSKENPTGKRKYVRKNGLNKTSSAASEVTGELTAEMSKSNKTSCKKSLDFDLGAQDESSAGVGNAAALVGKENGLAVQDKNVSLANDLNTSMMPPSSVAGDTQAPNASPSRRNSLGTKPKENQAVKRKYVRRKTLNKNSTPSNEVTVDLTEEKMPETAKTSRRSLNFDKGVVDVKSADGENAALHLGNEIGVVVQEMNLDLAHDPKISVEQVSYTYMSLPNDAQAPSTSPSKIDPPGTTTTKKSTGKRKYVRRKGSSKSPHPIPPAETAELAEKVMPESNKMSLSSSLNFDSRTRDESSAYGENLDVHTGKANGVVVEQAHVSLSQNQDSGMKQALNDYIALPEDTQAPNTSSKSNPPGAKLTENLTGKRKYVKRKGSNKNSTLAVMTGELTEATVLESARISSKTLNFDKSARDESNACRENLVHDQNTLGKQVLCSYMSLPEDLQPLSASISKSNPLEAKLNSGEEKNKRKGQATANDGNISNDQIPAIRSQMVGSKRKHSGTVQCATNSSMNLIGAHYNGFLSYETQFWVQFPNIQKKRRTEKGRTSDTNATSVITNKVQLTCPQEYAKALPYASSSSCWIYDSAYNAARGPGISESIENVVGNTGTFEEFVLSLRRITEASQLPAQNCSYTPLNIFRNYYAEQNYAAKQLGIFDIQTFGGAERPETSTDPLGAETHASLAKKNQKRKRSSRSRSRSAHPSTNEMQQHYNFALGNYLLPSPKSLDFACGVICQTVLYVEALAEQFRQLNINTEARALVPYNQQIQKQNSLANGDGTIIPFQGAFDPIKKQHPRPKVDLDEETDRVWKLLMLDINSHGIDGEDEVKAKWWEEERSVFRGRADSFIARMHLVQGDRRFSRWKGSVVDSVVGVFLTQNVSDHLSSSAYMSLAARFPLKTSRMCKTYQGEGTSLVVNEPQVHIVEPEEHTEWDVKLLNQSVHDQSSMTIDIVEHSGEKEAVNSNDSCRATSTVISLTDESNCTFSESSERNIKEHHSPMRSGLNNAIIEEGEDKPCYDGVRKDLNDIVSSQCSVISSQISGDLSNDQNPEKMGSCSDSNSEVEDLSTTEKYNQFSSSTSFVKLLEMVSSPKLYEVQPQEQSKHVQQGFSNISVQAQDLMQKERGLDLGDHKDAVRSETNEITSAPKKVKSKGQAKEKKEDFNWDSLRVEAQAKAGKREKTKNTLDSLDWDAVRCADVSEISNAIKERGMNNRLAERIQNFLNRLVEEHGEIDLEWLRDVPPDQAKEYLLSIRGLGLKSVECVRLLTLHHLAFPVDTNVGRIAVRLGWVPLQPLPESVQLHLLELYPVLESIQKYLWPRLCKLDQRTLYELHYQMITFGKVFCTKSKPNCNACPMRAECRHFASAFASARLALPGPEQRSIVVSTDGNRVTDQNPSVIINQLHLPPPENTNQAEESQQTEVSKQLEQKSEKQICLPIVEEPMSPEPEISQVSLNDIEDSFCDDPNEIPTIDLNMEEFTLNLQNYMQANMELQEGEMSKALVALNPETASIPMPKLKNVSRLRTEHCVYELPDTHPLLEGWDLREPDDPGKYLLAIWTPGETADSIQPPESKCSSQEESGQLCNEKECFSCNSFREANSQIVRGTLLIPCRTAMRGSFPLNGTYFQVNEVFADHGSSLEPISVPRSWIWNLNRRTVYFGTSVPAIFKGLSTPEIQQCFWRGYVCVRGFDRETRGPRPLIARLHFPASKMAAKVKEVTKKEPAKEKTRKQSKKKGSSSANSQGSNPNPDHPELVSNGHNLQEKGKA